MLFRKAAGTREAYRKESRHGLPFKLKNKILTISLGATVMFSCMVVGAAVYANVGATPKEISAHNAQVEQATEPMSIGTIKPQPAQQQQQGMKPAVQTPEPVVDVAPAAQAEESTLSESTQQGAVAGEDAVYQSEIGVEAVATPEPEPEPEPKPESESEPEPETDNTAQDVPSTQYGTASNEDDNTDTNADADVEDEVIVEGDLLVNEPVEDDLRDLANPPDQEEKTQEEQDAEAASDEVWRTAKFEEEIYPGDESEQVSMVQSRLMELGYMSHAVPTENFGKDTELGVALFQRNHEYEPTGIADLATLNLLMSDDAKMYQMSFNQEGSDIKQMQERLVNLGYTVQASGIYDMETEEMVMLFQKTNGLVEDGIVTLGTKAVLFSEGALDMKGKLSPVMANVGVESLIASAEQQLGKPYILGAKGPDAFDCSGLIYYCLNQSGYEIGYQTSGDWANSGYTTIPTMDELIRGDIVCFKGHVAIYLGNGMMLDASSSQGKIRNTENIYNSDYWVRNFICGKRVY